MSRSRVFKFAQAALFVSATLSGCADNRGSTSGGSAEDAKITEAVQSALAHHPDLGAPNQIYVSTRDHVVYLSGLVDSGMVRRNATDVASQVPGVARVVTTLTDDK